jgi:hypothetical protein
MARSPALILNSLVAVAVTAGAVPFIAEARHHAGKPHKPRKVKPMESIEAIETKAKAANAALDAGRAGDANALFDTALDAMGDRYRNPSTVDDTGMKLTLAKTEAAKGNMAVAAALKKSVVASRLAQFQQLHPAK